MTQKTFSSRDCLGAESLISLPNNMNIKPNPLEPPKNMNPHAILIWFQVCKNSSTKELAAGELVRMFTEACSAANIFPFSPPSDPKTAIQMFLASRRLKFVRFLDWTKLMVLLPVIRPIKRQVWIEPNGFVIEVKCQVRIEDPTWVRKLFRLKQYRFSPIRDRERRYVLRLDPSLDVFVYNDLISASNRWHIGYTVRCPLVPNYSGFESNREQYIMDYLWKPISAARRGRWLNRIRYL